MNHLSPGFPCHYSQDHERKKSYVLHTVGENKLLLSVCRGALQLEHSLAIHM